VPLLNALVLTARSGKL